MLMVFLCTCITYKTANIMKDIWFARSAVIYIVTGQLSPNQLIPGSTNHMSEKKNYSSVFNILRP